MVEAEKDILIPSTDDIITINQKLGGTVLNRGIIDFIIAKIEAKVPKKDYKRQIATIAAVFWFEIIQGHPFVDGNKRTGTEIMKLFLKKNGFKLNTPLAGLVYISLKIANNEISYSELINWLYRRLENGNLY
ncbi:death-on-curing family protein [Candidatus Methanoperedens nitroreducens]|uniref:Death-on-curing family protein n=1 Tax=Candidatus Methanoperedens nitratireducens TaxID=1392998 RepID=A0A062V5I9_9EURY|nr:type II toxin-antitoxin system death-on-curing family toxin [Candidatus Methanoperedens nitroreducens]KCZ71853.1 death-on-curing family protein [Candidatus Methanoperedens nitroreducens]MDJ1422172.1 type II toxin-antitoxin system death-on-curing family toxin [Candidatus Methanoperedens sp.]